MQPLCGSCAQGAERRGRRHQVHAGHQHVARRCRCKRVPGCLGPLHALVAGAGTDRRASTDGSDLDARLLTVSEHLTDYARALDVVHSENPITLDINRLTAIARTRTGSVVLREIGSAANYLGMHVAVHLALHRLFVDDSRPVPRFLMLDQPSQPYFPADPETSAATPADDRGAVTKMFKLLDDFTKELDGEFQIIVSDHLYLANEPWFVHAVKHDWHNGDALVPASWTRRDTDSPPPAEGDPPPS